MRASHIAALTQDFSFKASLTQVFSFKPQENLDLYLDSMLYNEWGHFGQLKKSCGPSCTRHCITLVWKRLILARVSTDRLKRWNKGTFVTKLYLSLPFSLSLSLSFLLKGINEKNGSYVWSQNEYGKGKKSSISSSWSLKLTQKSEPYIWWKIAFFSLMFQNNQPITLKRFKLSQLKE